MASRQWFQFRLATLLAVVTGICVTLGTWTNSATRQREAVARLSIYTIRYETRGPHILRDCLGRDYFDRVIEYGRHGASDSQLADVVTFQRLESLELPCASVTDAGLQKLTSCRLKTLVVTEVPITDAAFKYLRTDRLSIAFLDNTRIGDETVNKICQREIEVLSLEHTLTTGASLPALRRCPNLRSINLRGVSVGDADLVYLSDLKNLKVLLLDDASISDAGLVHLQNLRNLQLLSVERTHVTAEGVAEFKNHLPNTSVSWP